MRRVPGLLCLLVLSAGTVPAAGQSAGLPALQPSSCPAADSELGAPSHEDRADLRGRYDQARDSTFMFVTRRASSDRAFAPFAGAALPGAGPFSIVGFPLGLVIFSHAAELATATDTFPVTLVLDDFTTMHPGNLRIRPPGEVHGGTPPMQVGFPLSRAALLALLRARSALVRWGHWKVDLEESDIGTLRAFQRALLCAPQSLVQRQGGN